MLKGRTSKILRLHKSILMLIVSLSLLMTVRGSISAHGGEDHGDEQKAPITSAGQMNSQLATVGNVEVLVKYPTLKFGEETLLRVFINDRVTNAPIGGINLTMILNYAGSLNTADAPPAASFSNANNSAVQAVVSPTDTAGVYQALVTFPERGRYDLSIQLNGTKINEQVTLTAIVVPDKAEVNPTTKVLNGTQILLVVLLVLSSALLATWFLWLRSRRLPQASAETRERIESV